VSRVLPRSKRLSHRGIPGPRPVGARTRGDLGHSGKELGRPGAIDHMFKLLLITIVIVPVVLGMWAATRRSRRRSLALMLAVVLTYDVVYFLMLYYVRIRWVGWGSGGM
jgi:hypothetical protein